MTTRHTKVKDTGISTEIVAVSSPTGMVMFRGMEMFSIFFAGVGLGVVVVSLVVVVVGLVVVEVGLGVVVVSLGVVVVGLEVVVGLVGVVVGCV